MRKRIDVIFIALASLGVLFVLITGAVRINHGHYKLGEYGCFLQRSGRIVIVDYGAGNPVLKGYLLQLTSEKYLLLCYSDYDENFLGVPKITQVRADFTYDSFVLNDKKFVNYPPLRR